MNSMSKCNFDEKIPIYEQNADCDNHCKHPKPGKALLRCNNGDFGAINLFLLTPPFTQSFNQPIASVTIDTTCFQRQNLLIDFAGILTDNTLGNSIISTFTFTLFKSCKGSGVRQAVATFNFNYINVAIGISVAVSEALKFQYSSCDEQCTDCCTYTLELTSFSNAVAIIGTFSISGTLCALAVESSC